MQHRGGLTPPPAGRRRRATKPSSTTQHCLKKVYLHPTPLRIRGTHGGTGSRAPVRPRTPAGFPGLVVAGCRRVVAAARPTSGCTYNTHPRLVGVRGDRLEHQVPRDAVEELPDVQIDHPVVPPAALAARCDRVDRRPPRPVAVGIGVEDRFGRPLQYPARPPSGRFCPPRWEPRVCGSRRHAASVSPPPAPGAENMTPTTSDSRSCTDCSSDPSRSPPSTPCPHPVRPCSHAPSHTPPRQPASKYQTACPVLSTRPRNSSQAYPG